MIDRNRPFEEWEISCDHEKCGTYEHVDYWESGGDFSDAIVWMKKNGWKIFKEDGKWVHWCESCVEQEKDKKLEKTKIVLTKYKK